MPDEPRPFLACSITTSCPTRRSAVHSAAAALAIGVIVFPFFRLPIVVGIGWFMGKGIMAAVDGDGGRRYQYLAVGLTYLAILLGSLVPAIKRQR